MSKNDVKLPKSRTSSLLSMASKVLLREGQALFDSQAEKKLAKLISQSEIIVKHVGQLKGAAMKAVQMISVEAQDFLPPEVLRVLESLQSQAPPIDNEVMLDFLKKELGDDLFMRIKDLNPKPIASASIGQVYEAKINNEIVVIKIQYPEIANSVDSDLKILKKLVSTLLFVFRKNINIDELFLEVKRVLTLETDYINEVKSLLEYSKFFKSNKDYKIPEVYSEFCTSKVITLSKEDGLEFSQWIKNKPNQVEKEKIGHKLLNLYIKEFFEYQLVQTDPNPANFLVNNEGQLVLLDFGATLTYSKDFVKDYQSLLYLVFTGDDDEILNKALNMGFLSSKEDKETQNEFVNFLKLSLASFDIKSQPFDFSTQEYPELIRKSVLSFSKKLKYSPPPTQIIFLHRKLGGIFQMLRMMQVKLDLTNYRQYILAYKA
jgi:aarF domain-containing kinase